MKSFLELNKSKIGYGYLATSISLNVLVVTFMIVYWYTNNEFLDLDIIIPIYLTTTIAFPLFILIVAYLHWLHTQYLYKKLFKISPFNQLESIGFKDDLLNEKNKWVFTEYTKSAVIQGYIVQIDRDHRNKRIIK